MAMIVYKFKMFLEYLSLVNIYRVQKMLLNRRTKDLNINVFTPVYTDTHLFVCKCDACKKTTVMWKI